MITRPMKATVMGRCTQWGDVASVAAPDLLVEGEGCRGGEGGEGGGGG